MATVDMFKSIVASCDTYYYMLASETDIDDTHAFLSKFGFGRKTGIDIEGELHRYAAVARRGSASASQGSQVVPRRLDLGGHRAGL